MEGNLPASSRSVTLAASLPEDGGIRLARKTEWIEKPEGVFFGLGQRTMATGDGEFPRCSKSARSSLRQGLSS